MTIHRISSIILLIFICSTFVANAQKRKVPPEHPKLIISIVVEDMRYDYLYRYWDNFEEGGFKKLINEGTLCKNANYNYMLTQTAPGFATIATGCEPVVHGVVSDEWYQRLQSKSVTAVSDEKSMSIGLTESVESYSPGQMLTTTFADELKLFNNSRSKILGISFKPEAAVLAAGHMANEAYWFNDVEGKWVSSSYYCDSLPSWVSNFNNKAFPDVYIQREWVPLLAEENYRFGSTKTSSKNVGFDNDFKFAKKLSSLMKKKNPYAVLKSTPFGVSLTKDFAISAILDEDLGKDEFTDYLSVGFSSTSEVSSVCGPNSIELEDMYLRFDKELTHFLQFIDEHVGKENVLVFLTSDHGTSYGAEYLKEARIPAGHFNSDRAIMLLRTYLNAIYDKGNWISDYHNKQIYLNHSLIEDAGLNISDVQDVVSRFIIQFSGVANAVTATTLEETSFNDGVFAYMQNSYNQKRSGDIMINLQPGWIEKGKYVSVANSANKYDTHVPLIWYGWKIKRSKISRKVDMRDIAPTISNFLDIPYPNGCTGDVIYELER